MKKSTWIWPLVAFVFIVSVACQATNAYYQFDVSDGNVSDVKKVSTPSGNYYKTNYCLPFDEAHGNQITIETKDGERITLNAVNIELTLNPDAVAWVYQTSAALGEGGEVGKGVTVALPPFVKKYVINIMHKASLDVGNSMTYGEYLAMSMDDEGKRQRKLIPILVQRAKEHAATIFPDGIDLYYSVCTGSDW